MVCYTMSIYCNLRVHCGQVVVVHILWSLAWQHCGCEFEPACGRCTWQGTYLTRIAISEDGCGSLLVYWLPLPIKADHSDIPKNVMSGIKYQQQIDQYKYNSEQMYLIYDSNIQVDMQIDTYMLVKYLKFDSPAFPEFKWLMWKYWLPGWYILDMTLQHYNC